MRRGERIEVTVTALAFGGDSLGHAPDGRVVFFAGGAPGDRVVVRVDDVRPRRAHGTVVEVKERGSEYEAPRCALASECGGCAWQEVTAAAQAAAKQAIVERALGRLGASVAPLVAATDRFGYRSRMRLTRGEGASLGFAARRSHRIVDVPSCPLLEPALGAALALVRRHLARALPPGATVSALVGRDGSVHLALEGESTIDRRALLALAAEPTIAGIVTATGTLGAPTIDTGVTRDTGETGDTGETAFLSAAQGFSQASRAGNRLLRRLVAAEAKRLLDGVAAPRLLELHAGDGNFTRDLVRLAASVTAVEADRAACARLPANAAHARAGCSVRPLCLPAATACRRLLDEGARFDLVVLDPPRTGAADVAPLLAALAPRVLYVSCDPMTLARDAVVLLATGLAASRATPLDLMPHTSHVEVVCAFESTAQASAPPVQSQRA